jgi:cell division protein FtsB
MMEEAIEKASQLIMLLQKENKDVKKRNEVLEEEVKKMKKDDREL